MRYARNQIQNNPTAEPDNMHPHKRHAAAETRTFSIQALLDIAISGLSAVRPVSVRSPMRHRVSEPLLSRRPSVFNRYSEELDAFPAWCE